MERVSEHTVAFTFVEYVDGSGGKRRLSSKYYKIRDWAYANLSRESWVDVNNLIEINKDSLQFTVVGRFSARDIKGLRDFIAKLEGE